MPRSESRCVSKMLLLRSRMLMASISVFFLSGCSTIGYLAQAGRGQLKIMNRARPLDDVIGDERVSPRVRALLAQVAPIKRFGEQFGLKPTSNYREYVALDHPYVSYVVSACHPLRFEPKTWSFPIVGSFSYLGWFDPENAKRHAEKLKAETGWDVDVRGASAYSTLGWFRDPLLSSMINTGDEGLGDLANVVLHESLHATIYVSNQSTFNESLASFVADRLTIEFLKSAGAATPAETDSYLKAEARGEARRKKLHEAYEELDHLYRSALSDAEKLEKKAEILKALSAALEVKRLINNATLIQYKTYDTGGEFFSRALAQCGGDMKRFLQVLSRLRSSDFGENQSARFEADVERFVTAADECRSSRS